jgi:16S rRNA processing protein RimM
LTSGEDFILVGKLGRTRGVKGWIWVTPLTDFPDRFEGLKEIFVSDRDAWQRFEVEDTQLIGERPVMKFRGVNNREEASRLTNRKLAVPADQLVDLPEDTFYVFELIGCEVVDMETEKRLGELTDVRKYPANDVYVVKTDDGSEVLYPAVVDYVARVDIEQRKIMVRSAGLFDDGGEKTGK